MRLAKKFISAILALSSIMSLSACVPGGSSWIADYKGEKLPVGVYIGELVNTYYEGYSKVADPSKDILKQKIEDKDAKVWLAEKAAIKLKEYYAVNDKFDELGLKLTEDEIKIINTGAQNQYAANEELFKKNGIGLSSIILLNTNSQKSDKVFDKYYGKGGITPVSENDIKSSIRSENVKLIIMPFNLKPDATNKLAGDELAKIQAAAKSYLTRAQAGEKLADLIFEGEKASSTTPDKVTRQADAYYETVINKSETSADVQKLFADATAKNAGDIFMVESDTFIFVAQKVNLTDADYTDRSANAIYTLKSEEYKAMVTKWAEAVNVTLNEKATKYYTPSKLKLQ